MRHSTQSGDMITLHPELSECLDLPEQIITVCCPFCYKQLVAKFIGLSLLSCNCNNDFILIKNRDNPANYLFDSIYFSIYDYSIISTPSIQNTCLVSPDRLEVPLICLDFRNIDMLKSRIKLYLSHEYF